MRLAIVASLLVLAACAMPQYTQRPVSFNASPEMSFDQARAICAPRAQAASRAAPAGVKCNTAQLGYQAQTTCTPGPQTYAASGAAQQAGNAAYSGCLAEHGWRLERVCTQNCP